MNWELAWQWGASVFGTVVGGLIVGYIMGSPETRCRILKLLDKPVFYLCLLGNFAGAVSFPFLPWEPKRIDIALFGGNIAITILYLTYLMDRGAIAMHSRDKH